MVQATCTAVWYRGGQFVLQFDLGAAVQGFCEKYPLFHRGKYYIKVPAIVSSRLWVLGRLLRTLFGGHRDIGLREWKLEIIEPGS